MVFAYSVLDNYVWAYDSGPLPVPGGSFGKVWSPRVGGELDHL